MPRLYQIIPIVLARATNLGTFYQHDPLERGLILAARVYPNGLRKLYALRSLEDKYCPTKPEQMQGEIAKVKRAAKFPTHPPVPVSINGCRGLSTLEMSHAECQAVRQKALDFTASKINDRQNQRVELAAQIMLELHPQDPESQAAYLELWREGFMQKSPEQLEASILEYQQQLKNKPSRKGVKP
jgi:hypothetical protein